MRRRSTGSFHLAAAGVLTACLAYAWPFPGLGAAGQARAAARPEGWNPATHGADVKPDYARLFSMDMVHEIRISISPDSFRAMSEDLKSIGPNFGGGRGLAVPGPGRAGGLPALGGAGDPLAFMRGATAACAEKAAAAACSVDGTDGRCTALPNGPLACIPTAFADFAAGAGARGGRGAISLTSRDPMYVPVTVRHDGGVWTSVGMRYKGNSSLLSAMVGNNGKVPFRLDFDRYEDEDPRIRNQRFYGFRKLTFSSNFTDDSQIREVFSTEVFRDRGVPAPRAAFYRVFVDVGNGFAYWGLYSMIEDPADGAMLAAQFGSGAGNLYKPDGPGADWTRFAAEGFEKKTNRKADDFSDVERAVAALHAPQIDAAAWRAGLEAAFDVDHFLRWLAVNTAIQNWDVYGAMPHNYYLYGNPAQEGRLRWIPWDNNMALGMGIMGLGRGAFPGGGALPFPPAGARGGGPGLPPGAPRDGARGGPPFAFPFGATTDVLHRQVGPQWPLIQRLMADPVYSARYREHLRSSLAGLFAPAAAGQRMRDLHALIAPFVVGQDGERPTHTTISSPEAFERAIDGPDGLASFVQRRHEVIREALDVQIP